MGWTRGGGARRTIAAAFTALMAACSPSPESTVSEAANKQSPMPARAELGIFADVRGWIAYGNDEGIWAVNPGGTPSDRIQLSERPGEPVAWSSKGSKLLIVRDVSDATRDPVTDLDFFVLNASGAETRLTRGRSWPMGSISPDGSELVYSATTQRGDKEWRSGIYVVEADGGQRRLLLAAGLRTYPGGGTFRTAMGMPTYSPNGTHIAYFDGMGDWGNSLWVMDAEGTGAQALIDCRWGRACLDRWGFSHYDNLGWSSDGSHLAFNFTGGGIWVVGVDGSGLTKMGGTGVQWSPTDSLLAFEKAGIWVSNPDGSGLRQIAPVGRNPVWSPDGTRVAYVDEGALYVANLDGTDVRWLGTLGRTQRTTPVLWNPLPPAAGKG